VEAFNLQGGFDTLGMALLLLFQMFTGEGWHDIMYAGQNVTGLSHAWYFVTYVVIATLLFSNLLKALFLSNTKIGGIDDKVAQERARRANRLRNVRAAIALVTFIHSCSLHSAHANLTINTCNFTHDVQRRRRRRMARHRNGESSRFGDDDDDDEEDEMLDEAVTFGMEDDDGGSDDDEFDDRGNVNA
jgi:hypothetical protein